MTIRKAIKCGPSIFIWTRRYVQQFFLKESNHLLFTEPGGILTLAEAHSGELDEERSELSYVTDRSISPSDDSRLDRLPHVAISSRAHSLYQPRRRESCGSDGMSAVEVVEYLSHPDLDVGATDQPTSDDTQTPNPTTAVPLQPQHLSINVAEVRSRDISDEIENLHEGSAEPQVNMNAPSTPPLRRVRTRGAFIIGNGAPIKIDEGIEVYLRDGADGQVDFVI